VWRRFVDRVALKNATREIAKENKGKRKRETNRSRKQRECFTWQTWLCEAAIAVKPIYGRTCENSTSATGRIMTLRGSIGASTLTCRVCEISSCSSSSLLCRCETHHVRVRRAALHRDVMRRAGDTFRSASWDVSTARINASRFLRIMSSPIQYKTSFSRLLINNEPVIFSW